MTTRQVEGLVIPFGSIGLFAGATARFEAGSLVWGALPWLWREHQKDDIPGVPRSLEWTEDGDLVGAWRIRSGPAGDRALDDIVAGRRAHLSVTATRLVAELGDDGIWTVTAGWVKEVSLVTVPAFEEATVRVSDE